MSTVKSMQILMIARVRILAPSILIPGSAGSVHLSPRSRAGQAPKKQTTPKGVTLV